MHIDLIFDVFFVNNQSQIHQPRMPRSRLLLNFAISNIDLTPHFASWQNMTPHIIYLSAMAGQKKIGVELLHRDTVK